MATNTAIRTNNADLVIAAQAARTAQKAAKARKAQIATLRTFFFNWANMVAPPAKQDDSDIMAMVGHNDPKAALRSLGRFMDITAN